MPDYDLMSEDDFFSELKDTKDKQSSEKKPEPKAAPEPSGDDDLFSKPPEEDPGISENAEPFEQEEKQPGDFSQDVQDSLEIDEQEAPLDADPQEEEPEPEPLPEYEDEKQEGINYKPLVYIFLGVILLIVGYFVVTTFILTGGSSQEAQKEKAAQEAKAQAQKEAGPSPEQVRKKAVQNQMAAVTRRQMNFLGDFSSIAGKYSRISSILLYGDDLLIQVYGKDRAALAKAHLNLKKNFKNTKISIVSTDERPGGNGVLGLFKINLAASGGAGGTAEVSSPLETPQAAQQWLQFLAENSNLKLKNVQYQSAGEQDNFTVYELSASAAGKLSSCLKLLSAISSSAKNIKIHKLNLNAVDQKTFNPNKYQLKLIIKIFV